MSILGYYGSLLKFCQDFKGFVNEHTILLFIPWRLSNTFHQRLKFSPKKHEKFGFNYLFQLYKEKQHLYISNRPKSFVFFKLIENIVNYNEF